MSRRSGDAQQPDDGRRPAASETPPEDPIMPNPEPAVDPNRQVTPPDPEPSPSSSTTTSPKKASPKKATTSPKKAVPSPPTSASSSPSKRPPSRSFLPSPSKPTSTASISAPRKRSNKDMSASTCAAEARQEQAPEAAAQELAFDDEQPPAQFRGRIQAFSASRSSGSTDSDLSLDPVQSKIELYKQAVKESQEGSPTKKKKTDETLSRALETAASSSGLATVQETSEPSSSNRGSESSPESGELLPAVERMKDPVEKKKTPQPSPPGDKQ